MPTVLRLRTLILRDQSWTLQAQELNGEIIHVLRVNLLLDSLLNKKKNQNKVRKASV